MDQKKQECRNQKQATLIHPESVVICLEDFSNSQLVSVKSTEIVSY